MKIGENLTVHDISDDGILLIDNDGNKYSLEYPEKKDHHNGFTRDEFIDYLTHTLIPDLRESGSDATADDFETAVHFMTRNQGV